ncbi:hypothetical protein ACFL3E_00950 [Patescibacteria group bacterium]
MRVDFPQEYAIKDTGQLFKNQERRVNAMRNYRWYIEPFDSHTNEVISKELPEETFLRDFPDEHGKTHNVWPCNHQFVALMQRNQKQQSLMFRIFNSEGGGKMRKVTFPFSKRKKKKISKAT